MRASGSADAVMHRLAVFANVVIGSKAAVSALRPALEKRDPDLVKQIDAGFERVQTELGQHRAGDGWKLQTDLTESQLKGLSDAINALAEPISKIAGAIAQK